MNTIPTIEDVLSFLTAGLVIKKTQFYGKSESEIENLITKQLREQYGEMNIHRQYSVGGFLSLKCDIDLFDSKCCGIELKLAKQLKNSSAKERLIGQVIYYSKRCYQGKLIVLVVGTQKEYDTSLQEVQEFLSELGAYFVYKEIE